VVNCSPLSSHTTARWRIHEKEFLAIHPPGHGRVNRGRANRSDRRQRKRRRQGAAEELARMAATEHRRVVEGYRLQEKNSRVRLALEWALYRMGKSESLFTIVRALDSSRDDQATSYLNTLEDPEPLYFFVERMNGNTQIKLLDVLANIGDAGTLDKIKPYSNSFDSKIAEAAKHAAREIEQRLGEIPGKRSTRPRKANASENSP
jgi:hypothetical protein